MGRKPVKFRKGQRFNRLVVIKDLGVEKCNDRSVSYSLCRCDCGEEKKVMNRSLTTGHTQSCGCLMKEVAAESLTKTNKAHAKVLPENSRFGSIVVIAPTAESKSEYHCYCQQCSSSVIVSRHHLVYHNWSSCEKCREKNS